MAKVDTLQVNVWEPGFAPGETLVLTRFEISPAAQDTLTTWSREKTKRNENQPITTILRGLSEITGWFVPEVAFVRSDWDPSIQAKRLRFYFVGDVAAEAGLKQRMQMALQLWVNTLYPDKPAQARLQIAASALADGGWTALAVSSALERDTRACPHPQDSLYWDALAAHGAKLLAGRALNFASGESRILIPRTTHSSAFEGLELVAFPPRRGNDKGYWSEVITLRTATFPERSGVHLLARPSIRNWGSIKRGGGRQAPRRSLDIFLPAEDAFGHATRRHSAFQFEARRGPERADGTPPGVVGYWPHKDNEKVFDLLRRLTNRPALAPDELAAPIIDQDGLWVLPRLGTLHKDKYLPGGTGTAWPDRKDIGDSLEVVFAEAGFARAAPLTRRTIVHKLNTLDKDSDAARRALRDALAANQHAPTLSFYVFHIREATPARVLALLIERFGVPDSQADGRLEWADGLTIQVRSAAADVLSEELPRIELTPEESQNRNDKQLSSLRGLKREQARDAIVARMAARIKKVRGDDTGLACGLVEMPKALQDKAREDPFQLTRRELARHDVLPQVVLVETESDADAKPVACKPGAKPKDEEKYAAAIRDCFRMLGALPLDLLPETLCPAALTIVQRNAETFGLGSRDSQAIPLAARIKDNSLECALPDENGAPSWAPYARTALRIFQSDYGKFGRGKQADNITRFQEFFATVLNDINRAGPALVLAEGETIRHKLDTFLNTELTFDRLSLGSTVLTPQDLPNVRLVRVSPDPDRQPFYYHEDDNKWPSGLFEWDSATRTYYALKTKPVSVSSEQSFASMTSRHGEAGRNETIAKVDVDRVSSQLDEVCVLFHQPDDKPVELAIMTHRLRGAHVQTRADTASPFPLHELRLLAGSITF
jgi:hypothetical protein